MPTEYRIDVHYQESGKLWCVDMITHWTLESRTHEIRTRLGVAFTEDAARENAQRFLADVIVKVHRTEAR